jgi:RimJ/RimL family protein N-acetyltransferase
LLELVPLPEFDPALVCQYLAWFNDPQITYQIDPLGSLPTTAAGILGWMRSAAGNPNERRFTIMQDGQENGISRAVGSCALVEINREYQSAGIIIFIGCEQFRGQGLGTQALQLLINFAFSDLQLKRLFLGVDATNFRAVRAYTNCGFVEVARQDLRSCGGQTRLEYLMELVKKGKGYGPPTGPAR